MSLDFFNFEVIEVFYNSFNNFKCIYGYHVTKASHVLVLILSSAFLVFHQLLVCSWLCVVLLCAYCKHSWRTLLHTTRLVFVHVMIQCLIRPANCDRRLSFWQFYISLHNRFWLFYISMNIWIVRVCVYTVNKILRKLKICETNNFFAVKSHWKKENTFF